MSFPLQLCSAAEALSHGAAHLHKTRLTPKCMHARTDAFTCWLPGSAGQRARATGSHRAALPPSPPSPHLERRGPWQRLVVHEHFVRQHAPACMQAKCKESCTCRRLGIPPWACMACCLALVARRALHYQHRHTIAGMQRIAQSIGHGVRAYAAQHDACTCTLRRRGR